MEVLIRQAAARDDAQFFDVGYVAYRMHSVISSGLECRLDEPAKEAVVLRGRSDA